jgi:LmbE family N-acetylglucosaminyl deacetylase
MTRRARPPIGVGERHTVVSFHAHPDDETWLTGGTLAKAAAEGHRVVLVTATDGSAGMAEPEFHRGPDGLAGRRLAELHTAASAIGCASVELLGYADSGLDGQAANGKGFAAADVETAAARLAVILTREHAEVLTIYDCRGGYGHPDHVQVHRVGIRAAAMAGTPVVLEATVDRELLRAALRCMRMIGLGSRLGLPRIEHAYSPRASVTHRVDVRAHLGAKRSAMQAHTSQRAAAAGERSLAFCLRLPTPLFRLVFGHEWFVERGRAVGQPRSPDIFSSLDENDR